MGLSFDLSAASSGVDWFWTTLLFGSLVRLISRDEQTIVVAQARLEENAASHCWSFQSIAMMRMRMMRLIGYGIFLSIFVAWGSTVS